MIDEHKPHIILGCETHLDESYAGSEVFSLWLFHPKKKADLKEVEECLSQDISFLELSITTNAEMIWAKITLIHGEPIVIGSFNRLPENNADPIEDLKTALSILTLNHLILARDFNLPSITWKDGIGQTELNPTYAREVNSMFLDMVNEFGLEQQVYECTRGNHILDLVFASQPNVINNIFTIPGMSDHDAISFEVLTSLEKHKLQKEKYFNITKLTKMEVYLLLQKVFEQDLYN